MSAVLGNLNWIAVVILMMIGLYIVMAHSNLVKKLIGLSIFQSSAFIMFISLGKIDGGTAPILLGHGAEATEVVYSNPLPHVLMLTAIVVGVATTALGLALVVRIQEAYGTAEEDEIVRMDRQEDAG